MKGYIGSVPFTEEGVPHVTLDPGNSTVENETQILSFDERSSLLDSYLEATSGVLDLLTAYELETLLSDNQGILTQSSRVSGDLKAIFDLVFAIGAQARGVGNDPQISTSHFLRARGTAFQGMLMTQTLDMVRLFTLLTFYTLGACNRNAASMFLSVAAKAAVILSLNATGNHQNSSEEEICARVWISVRNLDVLSSFIFGRPKSLPALATDWLESPQYDLGRGRNSCPLFTAMAKACNLLDQIVDTLGINGNILHVPAAEDLLRAPATVESRIASAYPSVSGEMQYECHAATCRSPSTAWEPTHMGRALLRRTADYAPISRGILDVEITWAWVFGAGLVLGFSVFAGEPRKDIESAFHNAHIILGDIALTSPQARLYRNILTSFAEAINKYKQRVTDERDYTVQHYMDRVLIFDGSLDGENTSEERFSTISPVLSYGWQSYLATTSQSQSVVDLAGLPPFSDVNERFDVGHDDCAGVGPGFLDCLQPELESFDHLFYTVE
ncbi:hypothetical protein N7481_007913 [Penicillium waksmanii]|uniref:uncharacterized protein n=1 Tax=Penicillium waksmanii TaxID=69791 RepID=UPI0025470D28|nr:uncharacterized protein N7481_007913 [Penicillium waksmanii]KAJ5980615.1 hypothetical protein N7481_007913 [Penicillium waksmanii]